MKLEPNMYVRTKDGKIAKFIKYDEKAKEELVTDYYEYSTIWIKDVIKASHNIIDLIEVGDIVRYRLDNVAMETKGYLTGVMDIEDEETLNQIKNSKDEHILSIVTKEQFESMEYSLEG